MIGIFGTIMGFYFGSMQTNAPAESGKFSIAGPTTVNITQGAGRKIEIKLNWQFTGGKLAGNFKFSVVNLPKGFAAVFVPEQIGSGTVSLTVSAKDAEARGGYTLRVLAIPYSETMSASEHKITVVVAKK